MKPSFLFHVQGVATCPHQALVTVAPTQTRVLVNGLPVATVADAYTVAGCPFQVPAGTATKPQPCVTVRWTVPANRILVDGRPAVLQESVGTCLSVEQIAQGPPIVSGTQGRVSGL